MTNFYRLLRPLILKLDPEKAHELAVFALRKGWYMFNKPQEYEVLQQTLFGMNFENPIGLAAGFDKDAKLVNIMPKFGFGFIEVGTVTPLAQSGNDRPRLFRSVKDQAIINRMGFNNLGIDNFIANLKNRDKKFITGANIGKNKQTQEAVFDYITCLEEVYDDADYITLNVSSPNTVGLRNLQEKDELGSLLMQINQHRKGRAVNGKSKPLFLKVAPDLSDQQIEDIAQVALENNIDAIIVSNTTIALKNELKNTEFAKETGGLSGKPLNSLSTKVLQKFYNRLQGKIKLIGVGGIFTAQDAYNKILAGADLVQIYSAFIFEGFELVEEIKKDLSAILQQNGYKNISEAVGKGQKI